MDSVAVCRGCGRLLETDFLYCPWCGLERAAMDSEEIMDKVFDRLEFVADAGHEKRVNVLKNRMNSLENELNNLIQMYDSRETKKQ